MLKIHRATQKIKLDFYRTDVSGKYNPKNFCDPHIWCFNWNLTLQIQIWIFSSLKKHVMKKIFIQVLRLKIL